MESILYERKYIFRVIFYILRVLLLLLLAQIFSLYHFSFYSQWFQNIKICAICNFTPVKPYIENNELYFENLNIIKIKVNGIPYIERGPKNVWYLFKILGLVRLSKGLKSPPGLGQGQIRALQSWK